jgi:16S rRNA (uracil1498-N3)-methyltransferase
MGEMALPGGEAHHVRDVLRLTEDTPVEVFDDSGAVGRGVVAVCSGREVVVRVERIDDAAATRPGVQVIVASAVPKAGRSDWMVEKLSELGVSSFIPLVTQRSVVHPEGSGKPQRWGRIAAEAAKQSRRTGTLRVEGLMSLEEAIGQTVRAGAVGWHLSTAEDAVPVSQALTGLGSTGEIALFVGPEGGWTEGELRLLTESGLTGVRLTATILRVETAAIAAAAVVASYAAGRDTPVHEPGKHS